MANKLKAVVLAAGRSTRMHSEKTKVLHKILGKEIINYLLDSLVACDIAEPDIIVVVGDNHDEIAGSIQRNVVYALQREQLGTAHALLAAAERLAGYDGELLVVVGDNPYITAAALHKLIASHRQGRAQCTLISAVFSDSPPPYGRIIRDARGAILGVIEEKDATPEQRQIREMNASIYLFDSRTVLPLLAGIGNENAKKEYYLTDIIAIMHRKNLKVEAVQADDCAIAIGINDRRDLQAAQDKFNRQIQQRFIIEGGVTILQAETVTIEHDVQIGRDTVIYPCTYLAAGTCIGNFCAIGPFTYLKNVRIADGERVIFEKKEG
ncbi:MAG: NTP transferase domain-containing protein [Candidatus Aminicenantes bacterium]|nr:NTP transferase domain-containing protein [Candidatus Aminicenantes bacterium]